jgi:hypothetical protein
VTPNYEVVEPRTPEVINTPYIRDGVVVPSYKAEEAFHEDNTDVYQHNKKFYVQGEIIEVDEDQVDSVFTGN